MLTFFKMCEQELGAKETTAGYPDKTGAYEHITEQFEPLMKISTKFDSFFVNSQGATACSFKALQLLKRDELFQRICRICGRNPPLLLL